MIIVTFECCKINFAPDDMYTEQFIKLCNCWPGSVKIYIAPEDNSDELYDVYLMTMTEVIKSRDLVLSKYRQRGTFVHTFEHGCVNDVLVVAVNRSLMYGIMKSPQSYITSTDVQMMEKMSRCDPYVVFAELYKDSCYERFKRAKNPRLNSKARHIANVLHAMTDDNHVFQAWPGSLHPLRIRMTAAIERFIEQLKAHNLDDDSIDCVMGTRITCDLHRLMAHRSMELHLLYKTRGTVLGFVRAIEYDFCLNDHYNDFVQNTEFVNVQQIIGEAESILFI
ncbi:ORF22 [Alphabaculovirus altermyunipunctae]|uniref:ORF22 n=1 Tax=Mythimna unipuncta nucleopolyhedrovirus TaxID=447897 RepID=A0A346TPF9_9ABAC|nr:ORF22 [Mythimna unipuncta nucleopolyhedrovirus]AXU41469.1 ORF22 [Mythimna unipuncta nucleopolyhedrovirus]